MRSIPRLRDWGRAQFETRHPPGAALPLHRHVAAYAAIVVEGAYLEISPDGVFWCEPGCLVLHPVLHSHANRFPSRGARVLNIACPPTWWRPEHGCRVLRLPRVTPFSLARLTALDILAAYPETTPVAAIAPPRLARQAAALLDAPEPNRITAVARHLGVSREHLSREFRRWFGVSPRAYGAERRLRRVVGLLGASHLPISRLAQEAGFADHAHLTRTVVAAVGVPPSILRRWLRP